MCVTVTVMIHTFSVSYQSVLIWVCLVCVNGHSRQTRRQTDRKTERQTDTGRNLDGQTDEPAHRRANHTQVDKTDGHTVRKMSWTDIQGRKSDGQTDHAACSSHGGSRTKNPGRSTWGGWPSVPLLSASIAPIAAMSSYRRRHTRDWQCEELPDSGSVQLVRMHSRDCWPHCCSWHSSVSRANCVNCVCLSVYRAAAGRIAAADTRLSDVCSVAFMFCVSVCA